MGRAIFPGLSLKGSKMEALYVFASKKGTNVNLEHPIFWDFPGVSGLFYTCKDFEIRPSLPGYFFKIQVDIRCSHVSTCY